MFSSPWREAARESRRPGHAECQRDFSNVHPFTNKDSIAHGDSRAGGGGIRLQFSSKEPRQLCTSMSEGDLCRFTLTGQRRSRSGKRERSSKRSRQSLHGNNDRSTASLARSDSSSMTAGTLPDLDSWRNKLLLQALRETGEEMKRRRQTLKQVRARHATEQAMNGRHGHGARDEYRGYKGDLQRRLSSRTRTHHLAHDIDPAKGAHHFGRHEPISGTIPEADSPPHEQSQRRRDKFEHLTRSVGINLDYSNNMGKRSIGKRGDAIAGAESAAVSTPNAEAAVEHGGVAVVKKGRNRKRRSRKGSKGRAEGVAVHAHKGLIPEEDDPAVQVTTVSAGTECSSWTVEDGFPTSSHGIGRHEQAGGMDGLLRATVDITHPKNHASSSDVLHDLSGSAGVFDRRKMAHVSSALSEVSEDSYGASSSTSSPQCIQTEFGSPSGGEADEEAGRNGRQRDSAMTSLNGQIKADGDDRVTADVAQRSMLPDGLSARHSTAGERPGSGTLGNDADQSFASFGGDATLIWISGEQKPNPTAVTVVPLQQTPPPAPFRGTFWDDEDSSVAVSHNEKPTFGVGKQGAEHSTDKLQSTVRLNGPSVQALESTRGGQDIVPPNTVTSGPGVAADGDRYSASGEEQDAEEAIAEGRDDSKIVVALESGNATIDVQNIMASSRIRDKDANEKGKVVSLSDGGLGRLALLSHTKTKENRREFFEVYRRMARQVEIVQDTSALAEAGHTPRQDFVRRMLAMGRMPTPILLRDPAHLQDLNLAHKGLGDDVMCAAAEVLTRLPHIQTLNVADNRLTDRSLCQLCALVVEMPELRSLDLSSNKVDQAAAIIRGYLAHPKCKLTTLCLRSADVDDGECCHLMAALSRNESLKRLDVSENKIGQNEMLNAVQPDVVTGGEAIAATLAGNASLKELDLSWNNLRQESAAAIGRALCLNRGLESLSLAHNAFSDSGSQEVGDSLRTNSTLKSLNLSYNGLTPGAAIVIASACRANASLTRLTLDGNRLGRQGSAALIGAIRTRTELDRDSQKAPPLLLGLSGCDSESDVPGLFDPGEPTGEYKLDMSLPYSRMVISELISLSEKKKGYEFDGIWTAKDMASLDRPEKREKIKTEREAELVVGRLRRADRFAQDLAEVAKKSTATAKPAINASGPVSKPIASSSVPEGGSRGGGTSDGGGVKSADVCRGPTGYERSRAKETLMQLLDSVGLKSSRAAMEVALDELDWSSIRGKNDVFGAVFRAAFSVYDKNCNGVLDGSELFSIFEGLGCNMDTTRCKSLVSVYDINNSGFLETEEFVTWMMLEYIKEPESRKGRLIELSTGKPWPIPRSGFYLLSFTAARYPGELIHVETAEGLSAMMDNIRRMNTTTERLRMFENAALNTDMTITAKQAEMLAVIVERDQDRVVTAEKLLGQVVSAEERAQFLESFLDAKQRLRLAVRMRGLYRAVMGNPTGFYMLDLGSTRGRLAAQKLGEIANAERLSAVIRGAADTSQKGNNTPFRNEVLETASTALTLDWFVRIARRGQLRMDFVSTSRPRLSVKPLSDARLEALKTALGVDDEMQQIKESYTQLETARRAKKAGGEVRIWQQAMVHAEKAAKRDSLVAPSDANSASPDTTQPSPTEASKNNGGTAGGGSSEAATAQNDCGTMATTASYQFDVNRVFVRKDPGAEAAVPSFEVPDCINGVQVMEQWQQYRASSHLLFDFFEPVKRGGAGSSPGASSVVAGGGSLAAGAGAGSEAVGNASQGGTGESDSFYGSAIVAPARLYRWVFHRLLLLQTSACAAWYTCEQVIELANAFPWQDFGRVQAIISMFSRIIDVERFSEVVLPVLREAERRELQHRLGILNVLNPVRPDATYELDLRCWENREWAKILIKLAVEEPGPNWADMSYTHSRGVAQIWGWLLPESWTREDEDMGGDGGPRRAGILCLRYLTDPSIGCIARWEVRRTLQRRTLAGVKREL